MRTVTITVPGEPIPKGRPRFSTSGNKIRTFTPKKTRHYESFVAGHARIAMYGRLPLGGPLETKVIAHMSIPFSWSIKKKAEAAAGVFKPISKPDLDNLVKVLDSLNSIVFIDDSQIVDLTASKRYSTNPRLEITVIGQE